MDKQLTEKTDNELIAEFMGFTPTETHNLHGVIYSHPDMMGVYGEKAQKFKYDISWNWLMPVVEKIESIGYVMDIYEQACEVAYRQHCETYTGKTKIEVVYKAVVEFVRWYIEKRSWIDDKGIKHEGEESIVLPAKETKITVMGQGYHIKKTFNDRPITSTDSGHQFSEGVEVPKNVMKDFKDLWLKHRKMSFDWEWIEKSGCVNESKCKMIVYSITKSLRDQLKSVKDNFKNSLDPEKQYNYFDLLDLIDNL